MTKKPRFLHESPGRIAVGSHTEALAACRKSLGVTITVSKVFAGNDPPVVLFSKPIDIPSDVEVLDINENKYWLRISISE